MISTVVLAALSSMASQAPQGGPVASIEASGAKPLRVAVLVANARGDSNEPPLKYTESDARSVEEALRTVGSVDHVLRVFDGRAEALDQAFDEAESLLRRGPSQGELFFYYSGHADDASLHMSRSRYPLARLVSRLRELPSSLFVAVFDACGTGVLTRAKGAAPISLAEIVPSEPRTRGGVIISASAPEEVAQESDELGGSFFTRSWVAGLRGAADLSRDRRVSLEEAYVYAYRETVSRTSATLRGVQHPAFSFELSGQGDVVLSWLDGEDMGWIDLPQERERTYLVRSLDGQVLIEASSARDGPRRIVLQPGEYMVERRDLARVGRSSVRVERGRAASLDAPVTWLPLEHGTARGTRASGARGFSLQADYVFASGVLESASPTNGGRLAVTRRLVKGLDLGVLVGMGVARYRHPSNNDVHATALSLGSLSSWCPVEFGGLGLLVEISLGGTWIRQRATPWRTAGEVRSLDGGAAFMGAVGGGRFQVTDRLRLRGLGGVDATAFRSRKGRMVRASGRLELGLELEL